MPYASALFVVLLEVGVAVFATRPLPAPAHATIIAFWVWAVGRGTRNREKQLARQRRIKSVARSLGVPEAELQDEFAEFMATKHRPGGHDV